MTGTDGNIRIWDLLLLALLIFCLWSHQGVQGAQEQSSIREETAQELPEADFTTTVMLYICGSNLESKYSLASNDIQEVLGSGFDTEKTRVIILAGGSTKWNNGSIHSSQLNLFTVKKKHKESRHGLQSENVPFSGSMGEGKTLSNFLNYCYENHPSDRYELILWDHGGGPMNGVCWDEQPPQDHLSLFELEQALWQSPFREEKLELIGFDACLMGSVEVAAKLAPYARFMVSSQAEEPSSGWNYSFLGELEKDGNGAETGARILQTYFDTPRVDRPDLTMACVDLSRISKVLTAMDGLYSSLASQLTIDSFSSIAKRRIHAASFGRSIAFSRGVDSYDLVDVFSLSECFEGLEPEKCRQVMEAVEDCVLHNRSTLPDCHGLSVYHPFRNRDRFLSEWKSAYDSIGVCEGYSRYVEAYGGIMTGEPLVLWTGLDKIRAKSVNGTDEISLDISKEQAANMASVKLIILGQNLYDSFDESYFRVYTSNDVSVIGTALSAKYDGSVLRVYDSSSSYGRTGAVSFRLAEDDTYLVDFYPREKLEERPDFSRPIIGCYQRGEDGSLQLKNYEMYDEMTGTYSPRVQVNLSSYAAISFLRDYHNETLNELGERLPFEQWEQDPHKESMWQDRNEILPEDFVLRLTKDESYSEQLYAAFEMTDTQGTVYMSDLVLLPSSAITHQAVEGQLDPEMPIVFEADVFTFPDTKQAAFLISLANASSEVQSYALDEISFNGISFPEKRGLPLDQVEILPGETCTLFFMVSEEEFRERGVGEYLEKIAARLIVLSSQDTKRAGILLEPNHLSIRELLSEEKEEDLSFVFPALGEEDLFLSAYVSLRPDLETKYNSRLLLHTMVQNTTGEQIEFFLTLKGINGVEIEEETRSMMGSHAGDEGENPGSYQIEPGETGAGTLNITYEQMQQVLPAVAVRSVLASLSVYTHSEERTHIWCDFDILFMMDADASGFHLETDILPSFSCLTQTAKQMCSFERKSPFPFPKERPLFSYHQCSVSLGGVFWKDNNLILYLIGRNEGETDVKIVLGDGKINGFPASLGRRTSANVNLRNRRNQNYLIPAAFWESPTGAVITLPPKQTVKTYVQMLPADAGTHLLRSLSFGAAVQDASSFYDRAYFEKIDVAMKQRVLRREGMEGYVPPLALRVSNAEPVQPAPEEPVSEGAFIQKEVSLPAKAPEHVYELSFPFPEGEDMARGYYLLLKRITSDAQLAAMNISNDQTDGMAEISFQDGRFWYLYEACGILNIDKEEKRAWARCPGLLPAIQGTDGSLPVYLTRIRETEDGGFLFEQADNRMLFFSVRFPDYLVPAVLKNMEILYSPVKGEAAVRSFEIENLAFLPLMELLEQSVFLFPSDNTQEESIEYFREGMGERSQSQVLLLPEAPRITTVLEPVDFAEYDLALLYQDEQKQMHFTEPVPFLSVGREEDVKAGGNS